MPATRISPQDFRERLDAVLDRVEAGEDVVVTRSGRPPIRLVLAEEAQGEPAYRLPDLQAFRSEIRVKGAPLSETVVRLREEERE